MVSGEQVFFRLGGRRLDRPAGIWRAAPRKLGLGVLLASLCLAWIRPALHAQTVVEASGLAILPADFSFPQSDNEPGAETPEPTSSPNEAADALKLADVIASLYRAYPVIAQARLERARAGGQLTGAYGAYDTKLQGYTLSEPTGFYRNFRHGIGVARQTWWGGYVSAGYRVGRGDFQPWYKERETNESGEFTLGVAWPLLQGRAIDAQRVAVFQASLAMRAADPLVQSAILSNSRDAALAYWKWVSLGMTLQAQRELLQLAEQRGVQFEEGVAAGKFAEVDLIFNQQLIAERGGKVIETDQAFRAAGFKLSIFLRDESGQPILPEDSWLPEYFPQIQPLPPGDLQQDIADALQRRPELQQLRFDLRQIQWERQLACNHLLPRVDVIAEASQDVGVPASSINDKGQFELIIGLQGEVPVQRRKARGKIQETGAKLAQIEQKLRLVRDKISIELQTAYNGLQLSARRIEQAEVALLASIDTLARYRFAFERGRENLIFINLLESKVNEAEIQLVDAQQSWFAALAAMQFALGLDPLDQAIAVSRLAPSGRPGPAHLPAPRVSDTDETDPP